MKFQRRDFVLALAGLVGALALAWIGLAQDFGSREVAPVSDVLVELARLDERVKGLHVLLAEREKQLDVASQATKIATDKAEEAQARVNATQNEFRGALKDQAALLATRVEVLGLLERIQNLERAESALSGRAGGVGSAANWFFDLAPLILSVLTVLVLFWDRKRAAVEPRSPKA